MTPKAPAAPATPTDSDRTYDPEVHAPHLANRAHYTSYVDESEELSVLRVVNPILRYRRFVVAVPAVLFSLVVGIGLLLHRTYSTTVSFMPSTQTSALGQAAGLAAKFGVALPGQDPTQSPDFYADLLGTTEFLKKIALSRYTLADKRQGNLLELLDIAGSNQNDRLYTVLKRLTSDIISVEPDRETDIVNVTVHTRWPELSEQIASTILDQVNAFNIANRQYQAEQERQFMQSRVDQSAAELRSSENDLQAFLERNRDFRSDPQLSFQYDRLQRAVTMRQDVYTTLMQSVEQARVDAARNTPAIVIIEHAAQALKPDRRGLLTKGILAIVGGFMFAVFIVLVREFVGTRESVGSPQAEFAELRAATMEGLRRLLPFRKRHVTAR